MKMTSAYANKLLRQLDEDKAFYVNKESESCEYTVAVGEEAVIPEYDYREVADTIAAIDKKIQIIKHAINLANVNSEIKVGDECYSVDSILVRMTQLNRRKAFLDCLRKKLPKERVNTYSRIGMRGGASPEYRYINYDLDEIKRDFEIVSEEIMRLQIELDKHNQTYEFEVPIE